MSIKNLVKSEQNREILEYINERVTKLEVDNWNKYHNENEFSMGRDKGYRDVIRILSDELNKY